MRKVLKLHLTKTKKGGKPRCPGLKAVIPSDVWVNGILPHYKNDASLPDLSLYMKKAPFDADVTKIVRIIAGIKKQKPWSRSSYADVNTYTQ